MASHGPHLNTNFMARSHRAVENGFFKVDTEKLRFWSYFGKLKSKKWESWEFDKSHVDGSFKT